MKKTLLTLICLATMMLAGMGLKAQEIMITLSQGWNWISYPNAVSMEIGEAMGDFVPMEGDIIKSQFGFAEYSNGQWMGGFTHFMPGKGYKYYSSRSEAVSFIFAQPSSSVVATATPTDITAVSAVVGGMVMLPEGSHVFLRGVCWGTTPSPDIDGNHTTNGTGIGMFTTTLDGLNPNTTYYVRAYAVSDYGLAYGNQQSFTTIVEYQYVDLGLPSGTLWATFNVGATAPEEYGDYFAWGETQPKDDFSWSNYQYSNGGNSDHPNLTKYCNISGFGYNGFTDNLTILEPNDDAATANWGSDWRMPTIEEWWELYQNTTETNAIQNGVNGRLFTASNGNSIFIPAADYPGGGFSNGAGNYWSSSLYTDYPGGACYFMFGSNNNTFTGFNLRCNGSSVRPVRVGSQNTSFFIDATANPVEGGEVTGGGAYQEGAECILTATPNEGYTFTNWTENDEVVSVEATYTFTVDADRTLVANFTRAYVDLGLPSGLLWATCNVGADTPEAYGDYFAWGETQPKEVYDWSTYQHCMGSEYTLTKYCNDASYGYNGFIDNLITLLPEDDAATANWGADWHMPTQAEWQELLDNTSVEWTTQNGVNGRLFTASNGNSLFLPASGYRNGSSLYYASISGGFWSSSLGTDSPYFAWRFGFNSGNYNVNYSFRNLGVAVRPVRSSGQNNAPTGAINGKFTINADGDQVYFSQGNLQYQASTNTWRFADNQYDYVGSDNSNISSTYSGWIDLFGWGTSGWNSGNTYYHPYDFNTLHGRLYGPSGNHSLTGSYANADWGIYNMIINGGSTTNMWRTLTSDEWYYVFFSRSTTLGICYAKAQVNGMNGIILLPDNWNIATYSLSNANSSNASFSSNSISATQWIILENAGAVFLPAAGFRYGTSLNNIDSNGCYWSASHYNDDRAYRVSFSNSYLGMSGFDRLYGQSVRLVAPFEN